MECDFQKNYLSSTEAAGYLSLKPQTLRKWRLNGYGPPYVRLGNNCKARVVYRLTDIEAWLTDRTFSSTSEESQCTSLGRGE